MKATQFITIGQHDSERNSWIPDGDIRHVVSCHNTESAAWLSAHRAHTNLGGCDGSDMLAKAMKRFARIGSRKAAAVDDFADTYEHAGWLYVECDFWAGHEVVPSCGQLGLAVR